MKSNMNQRGFTIVELLIVVVVIAILAAITIVAYNGIQNSAKKSSMVADLNSTMKQIELFKTEKSTYPSSINDCPNPSAQNICSKTSASNTLTYFVDTTTSPNYSCIVATNNGVTMELSNGTAPTEGNCLSSFPSCLALKNSGAATTSGQYTIKLRQSRESIPVYCDMTTSDGGWTLLLTNPGPATIWNTTNVLSVNTNTPSTTAQYSILNKADEIKSNINGNLYYRLDANTIGQWGGVWSAPYTNTFTGSTFVTNVTNVEKYGTHTIGGGGIKNTMPWLSASPQILSTWTGNTGDWWGTIVGGSTSYSPAPWINSAQPAPGRIWYWVR